jgi:outer membrane protein assembly factor BamB
MKPLYVLLLSTLLVACSSNDSVDLEPADLVDIENELDLDALWSEDVGAGTGENFSIQAVSIANDSLFSSDAEGLITALDRNTGDELWETHLDQPVSGGTGVAGDLVVVGTLTGNVIALDSATGESRWQASVGGEVLAAPQGNASVVVVQTLSGRVYGLNAADGSELWMHESVTPALTLRGTATPVVWGSSVITGFSSGKMISLDINEGIPQWEQRVAVPQGRSELERVVDVDGSPLLIGDSVFSASYQGRLVAINRTTGKGLWVKPESTYNNMAGGMGYVFVADAEGRLKAYNATNGNLVWENDQMLRRELGAPQTFGNYVAVADFEGYVHVVNQADGQLVARRKVDGDGVRSPMLGMGNVLYVHGNSGELEALSIQ